MRVLVSALNLRRGGLEKIAILLTAGLRSAERDSRLVAIQSPIEYRDLLERVQVEPELLFPRAPYFWTAMPSLAREFKKAVRAYRPHRAIVFGGQAAIIARLAGVIPLTYGAQNASALHWAGRRPGYLLLRFLERWALHSARMHVVACSESVRTAYEARFPHLRGHVSVVPNATDASAFLRQGDQRSRRGILMVGTLYDVKNYPMALEALAELQRQGSAETLTIAGDGPDRERLVALASRLGIRERVQFLGRRDDIPELMAAHKVFWITSKYEGFGIVIAEAMLSGLPVVGTAVAGIIDVIKANQTGYLVEPWDVRGLADITRGLLGEASGARPVVESAHRAALEQFTPERMVQQYAAILERAPSLRGAGDPGQ